MLSVAFSAPTAVGLNAMYTTQLPVGASVAPHVSSASNDVGLVPVSVIELSVIVAVPPLVNVTATAGDVVPTFVVANVRLVALSFSVGAAAPVPVNVTFCGEPVALSVMLMVPVSAAAAVGLNPTYSEQEAPAASDVPHVPNSSKDVALVPPSTIELIVTATVPVFFTVTICASLVAPTTVAGKAIDVGVSVSVGVVTATPVPLSATSCGEPLALSAIASEAVAAPPADGLNSTETVQLAPTAIAAVPHVFAEMRKELALVPVSVIEVSDKAAVPVFFTVTICAAVVLPTFVDAKVSEVGVSVTAGVVAAAVLIATVSRPKSVHSDAHVVMLNTAFVMLAAVWSIAPRYTGSPAASLATVYPPSSVLPLYSWICPVNAPGKSACSSAPTPATLLVKSKVTGPLPPLPASDVHSRLCPAVNPVPVQLHGLAEHTTDTTLFAAPRLTVVALAAAVFAVKLAASTVPSAPFWFQLNVSFEP